MDLGRAPGRLKLRGGIAAAPCWTRSATGVPWLVMTTRMPDLACLVKLLSFAFASRKGTISSVASRAARDKAASFTEKGRLLVVTLQPLYQSR